MSDWKASICPPWSQNQLINYFPHDVLNQIFLHVLFSFQKSVSNPLPEVHERGDSTRRDIYIHDDSTSWYLSNDSHTYIDDSRSKMLAFLASASRVCKAWYFHINHSDFANHLWRKCWPPFIGEDVHHPLLSRRFRFICDSSHDFIMESRRNVQHVDSMVGMVDFKRLLQFTWTVTHGPVLPLSHIVPVNITSFSNCTRHGSNSLQQRKQLCTLRRFTSASRSYTRRRTPQIQPFKQYKSVLNYQGNSMLPVNEHAFLLILRNNNIQSLHLVLTVSNLRNSSTRRRKKTVPFRIACTLPFLDDDQQSSSTPTTVLHIGQAELYSHASLFSVMVNNSINLYHFRTEQRNSALEKVLTISPPELQQSYSHVHITYKTSTRLTSTCDEIFMAVFAPERNVMNNTNSLFIVDQICPVHLVHKRRYYVCLEAENIHDMFKNRQLQNYQTYLTVYDLFTCPLASHALVFLLAEHTHLSDHGDAYRHDPDARYQKHFGLFLFRLDFPSAKDFNSTFENDHDSIPLVRIPFMYSYPESTHLGYEMSQISAPPHIAAYPYVASPHVFDFLIQADGPFPQETFNFTWDFNLSSLTPWILCTCSSPAMMSFIPPSSKMHRHHIFNWIAFRQASKLYHEMDGFSNIIAGSDSFGILWAFLSNRHLLIADAFLGTIVRFIPEVEQFFPPPDNSDRDSDYDEPPSRSPWKFNLNNVDSITLCGRDIVILMSNGDLRTLRFYYNHATVEYVANMKRLKRLQSQE